MGAKTHGLFAYNSVRETARTVPDRLRFVGLAEDKLYRLKRIWPMTLREYSASVLSVIENQHLPGEALMQFGLQMPITRPQTAIVFELTEQSRNLS